MADRDFLVVLRCGDGSLHPSWLAAEKGERTWDLHLSYFGTNPERYSGALRGDSMSFEKGPKYHGLFEFIHENLERLRRYELIAFPDDDLQFVQGSWSEVFARMQKTGAGLAQPSLDRRSFWMHDLLLQRRRFSYREVDFIEVMTPVFEIEFLLEIYNEFKINKSSWGLDYVWSARAKATNRKLIVLDTCAVLHTRRVGKGSQYGGKDGGTLYKELDQTLADRGLKTWYGKASSAWTDEGRSNEPLFLINREEYLPRIYNKLKDILGVNVINV
jgi:hypothetical protein